MLNIGQGEAPHERRKSTKTKEIIIRKKYKLVKRIGHGSFGEIYLAININTNQELAIKMEKLNAKKQSRLFTEAQILKNTKNIDGFPEIYWYGSQGDFNIMVMDLLGYNLGELLHKCNKKFSVTTVALMGDQMLTRLEALHKLYYMHRDVKPENFLIGSKAGEYSKIYLIDFGLCRRYRDLKSKLHIPYREGKKLAGTARYVSINTHVGIEQSRRDDLEGLGYVLTYFLRGELPWQGIKGDDRKEKYERIMLKKMATPLEALLRGYPTEFLGYFSHCKGLNFEDEPNYSYCHKLFREIVRGANRISQIFDWIPRITDQYEILEEKRDIPSPKKVGVPVSPVEGEKGAQEADIPQEKPHKHRSHKRKSMFASIVKEKEDKICKKEISNGEEIKESPINSINGSKELNFRRHSELRGGIEERDKNWYKSLEEKQITAKDVIVEEESGESEVEDKDLEVPGNTHIIEAIKSEVESYQQILKTNSKSSNESAMEINPTQKSLSILIPANSPMKLEVSQVAVSESEECDFSAEEMEEIKKAEDMNIANRYVVDREIPDFQEKNYSHWVKNKSSGRLSFKIKENILFKTPEVKKREFEEMKGRRSPIRHHSSPKLQMKEKFDMDLEVNKLEDWKEEDTIETVRIYKTLMPHAQ